MKKIGLILLMLVLLVSFSYADSLDKLTQEVNETNVKIEEEIEKTVAVTLKEAAAFQVLAVELTYGKAVLKAEEELLALKSELNNTSLKKKDALNLQKKINEQLAKIEEERIKHQAELEKNMQELAKKEMEFLAKIEEETNKLLDKTNEMSAKIVAKAAEQDVLVICEWVPVEINGKIVMVDPLRVFSIHH